jgi:UDP-GlcNAc:undecaprenyl-phosphate/decaprenyl-phosphate GlcNAc-1-phosphate transferase
MSFSLSTAVPLTYLTALAVTLAVTPLARRLAVRAGAVAHPNERTVHKTPIASAGGTAIIIGFYAALFLTGAYHQLSLRALIGLSAGALFIAAVGFVDDCLDVPAKIKLALQFLSAVPLLVCGLTIGMLSHPLARGGQLLLPIWISWFITVIWVVATTNAVNLIDGLDGLASGVTAIACTALAFIALQWGQPGVALLCASLAGAAIGFLVWNWHPASILMGDTGAYFLGFVIAAATVQGAFKMAAAIAIFVPLLVLAVPLLDTTLSPVRRILRGRHPFKADRDHLHHRLLAMGLSQTRVVLLTYIVTAVCCALAIWMS